MFENIQNVDQFEKKNILTQFILPVFLQCFSVLFRSVLLPKSHQKPIHPDAEPRVQNSAGCGGRGVEIDGVSIIGVEDAR